MCYRTRRTREDRGLLRVGALKKSTGCIGPSEARGFRKKGHPPLSPTPRLKDGTRVKDT